MSTTVTTVTKSAQVFTRTWGDLDPKVRNALCVWALAFLGALGGLTVGRITLLQALAIMTPVSLAVATAYATTSKHKQIIQADAVEVDKVAHDLAPLVEETIPEAAPVVAAALDAVDTISAALTPETTDLAKVTAGVTDPTPATAVIQAAVLPTPVQ